MALVDFTTYDDIRAALGVESDELKDDTLALQTFENGLEMELMEVAATLASDYLTAYGKDAADRTSAEQTFIKAANLFATYAVAKQCLAGLPMFAPKTQGDSKSELTRFAQNPFQTTIARVEASFEKYRGYLVAAYGVVTTPVTVKRRTYFRVSSPTSDPVTD